MKITVFASVLVVVGAAAVIFTIVQPAEVTHKTGSNISVPNSPALTVEEDIASRNLVADRDRVVRGDLKPEEVAAGFVLDCALGENLKRYSALGVSCPTGLPQNPILAQEVDGTTATTVVSIQARDGNVVQVTVHLKKKDGKWQVSP